MTIEKNKLIEFVNFINECCCVMDDSFVADWLNLPNSNLNMSTPLDLFKQGETEKLYRLLYFIDIEEADLY